jgi:opacity protein-like surface antigen
MLIGIERFWLGVLIVNRKVLLGVSVSLAIATGAVQAASYTIELTENGVGDAGPDWFGTVELDAGGNLISARVLAKGHVFDEVGISNIGTNMLDPVNGTRNTWILSDPYSDGPTAGLQFWGNASMNWSFDTDCGMGGSCGGLPLFGNYRLTEIAPVPLPASLPLLLGAIGGAAAIRQRRRTG